MSGNGMDPRTNLQPYDPAPSADDTRGGCAGHSDFEVIAMIDNGAIRRGDGSLYIHEWMISTEPDVQ